MIVVVGVVGRQDVRVRATEVEGVAFTGRGLRGGRGDVRGGFLGSGGAVGADLAGGDAEGLLAEHVGLEIVVSI